MYKKDHELGKKIHKTLVQHKLETPMGIVPYDAEKDKHEELAANFKRIMQLMGLDLRNDSLAETPKRVAKMFLDELFWGLDYKNFPKMTTNENAFNYTNMLVEVNIPVKSMCEHHFIPIKGVAHVAYIPSSKVVGLSKLNRLVHFFSRRPQVQERLTKQVLKALQTVLETQNVAVMITAEHLCVSHRGVQDHGTMTTTTELGGNFFSQPIVRQEFLETIKLSSK